MNILIIGGGGFLGVPLSNKLKSLGHFVMVYDNFKHNTQNLLNCCYVNKSVKDLHNLNELNFNYFDIIFYLAQPRLEELTDEDNTLESINDFKNFLNGVNGPKVFFISSCSVYGKTDDIVNEKSESIVTSYYSKMKIECERYLLSKKNNDFKILRLSTLYGNSEPLRKDIFINNMLEDITDNKKIEIFDPTAKRPHLHINDCVNILTMLIEIEIIDNIINIGFNELNVSKIDLIELIKKCIDFNYVTYKTEDSRNYHVNFDLLEKYINYAPISYLEGIKDYLKLKQ
jgi:nucleoside-diphosphate-sugar epimerase